MNQKNLIVIALVSLISVVAFASNGAEKQTAQLNSITEKLIDQSAMQKVYSSADEKTKTEAQSVATPVHNQIGVSTIPISRIKISAISAQYLKSFSSNRTEKIKLIQQYDYTKNESEFRRKIQQQYPNLPLFIIDQQLPNFYEWGNPQKLSDAHSNNYKYALFNLDIHELSFPVLNNIRQIKDKVRAKYSSLSELEIDEISNNLLITSLFDLFASAYNRRMSPLDTAVYKPAQPCYWRWHSHVARTCFGPYIGGGHHSETDCIFQFQHVPRVVENHFLTQYLTDPNQKRILKIVEKVEVELCEEAPQKNDGCQCVVQ